MKIAVDAGALCADKTHMFGTAVVTENMLEAFAKYDLKNKYSAYIFKKINAKNTGNISYKKVSPMHFWSSLGLSAEELMHKHDVFLALSQSIPFIVPRKVITISHGLSFMDFPELYPDSYPKLREQVDSYMYRSNTVMVSSSRVKKDLQELYKTKVTVEVLPFGIPFDMITLAPKSKIINPYFLYVGMDHPIKNIKLLIQSFNKINNIEEYRNYSLYLVGNFDEYKYAHKKIKVINNISRARLKLLFRNAKAYLTTSLYESFNLPVLEALSQNCPVVGIQSAIIPELQKYVEIVNRNDIFVDKLISVIKKPKEISLPKLRKEFSWKRYIKKLTSFYD